MKALATVGVTLACLSALAMASRQDASAGALDSMVAAERAFAAATKEIGVRNGFLTFFADDAVALEGAADGTARVVPARARIATGPASTLPVANVLSWSPYIGQASADGAFGWLTGPYENRNSSTGAVGHGIYFSVWRRQSDGTWKVWLDQGITTPQAWAGPTDFRGGDRPARAAVEVLSDVESQVATDAAVWASRLAPSVRLHRNGIPPVLGRDAVSAWRAAGWQSVRYATARTETSAARDMAVELGGYAATTASGPEYGIFARVWHAASDGRRVIVFETSTHG